MTKNDLNYKSFHLWFDGFYFYPFTNRSKCIYICSFTIFSYHFSKFLFNLFSSLNLTEDGLVSTSKEKAELLAQVFSCNSKVNPTPDHLSSFDPVPYAMPEIIFSFGRMEFLKLC